MQLQSQKPVPISYKPYLHEPLPVRESNPYARTSTKHVQIQVKSPITAIVTPSSQLSIKPQLSNNQRRRMNNTKRINLHSAQNSIDTKSTAGSYFMQKPLSLPMATYDVQANQFSQPNL